MKIVYIECNMGVAGDMLMSALYEVIPNKQDFLQQINNVFQGVAVVEETSETKCGITGTRLTVKINGIEEESHDCGNDKESHDCGGYKEGHGCGSHFEKNHGNHAHARNETHCHSDLHGINHIIQDLNLSENVKNNAKKIYEIIANAESKVHNQDVNQIHFHEVGEIDAIVDIVGSCIAFDQINPEKIVVSPINLGSGFVKCAHGILPVPAPATAEISKGISTFCSDVLGELATPTGVAVIKHFANSFSTMPKMKIESIGYGMGKKNFEKVNCVRVFLGNAEDYGNEIAEISCNIDDMTSEEVGFAVDVLLKNKALDVYTMPIYMKKNRPAFLIACICKNHEIDKFSELIFKHTTTLGVRINVMTRKTLNREIKSVETSFGEVHIKVASGEGVLKTKIEYEDIAKISTANGLSLFEVKEIIKKELGI